MADYDGDIVDFIDRRNRYAAAQASLGAASNPDDAARAVELEGITGIPASVSMTDVKGYELKAHQTLASRMIAENGALRDYVAGNPMAAHVSNDDYDVLAEGSRAMKKMFDRATTVPGWYKPPPYKPEGSVERFLAGVEGFKEGFRADTLPTEMQELWGYLDGPVWRQLSQELPIATAVTKAGVMGGAAALTLSERAFTGALYGAAGYLGATAKQVGMGEAEVNRLKRDAVGMGMMALSGQAGIPGGPEAIKAVNRIGTIARELGPYLEVKEPPPRGFNEFVDDIKKEQSEARLDSLDEAGKAADKSATKERSPDLYAKFVEQHTKEDVHISAEAVRALYGDEVPSLGDGKLGFVPDLAEQLAVAEPIGGFVRVPMMDWLARVDKEVRRALKDDVKLAEDLTRNELKEKIEYRPTDGTMLDAERNAAGAKPMFGELAEPEPERIRRPGQPKQLELDVTRMEDQPIFKEKPPGISKERYELYTRAIERVRTADRAAEAKKIEAEVRRMETKEWKARRAEVRSEAEEAVRNQPYVQVDEALRRGGRLDPSGMTKEQADALKGYTAKDGISPDDLAPTFGYVSGDVLVNDLARYIKQRGKAGAEQFVERMIESVTDMRMRELFGDREENIKKHVHDRLFDDTQLDLIHEDTLLLAELSGQQLPLDRRALENQARKEVLQQRIGRLSSREHMALAGKATRAAEEAFLKGDPAEAFRLAQQRELAMLRAKQVAQYEKLRAQFDKRTERFGKRQLKAVDQAYTDMIHYTMHELGLDIPRTFEDVVENAKRSGYESTEGQTLLGNFVDDKSMYIGDHVPGWLVDPEFKTPPLEHLTLEQFQEVAKTLEAMEFVGREEKKVNVAGAKADLAEVIERMINQVKDIRPEARVQEPGRKRSKVMDSAKAFWWSGINVETMLNRLDRDNPNGIFHQALIREYSEGALHQERLERDYQRRMAAIGKIPDMDKIIPNDLFIDPITGQPHQLRKRNVLAILQNMGNESNVIKLTKPYGIEPVQVWDWLGRVLTKEDLTRAQKIGEMFNELFEQANVMSHEISGVGIERVPLEPIQTPWGVVQGWYNPVKYDPLRAVRSERLRGKLEEEGYYRATTPQGYTKTRTGYIDFMDLTMDIIPIRMKQMIHDIALRPAVLQMSKFVYDGKFKQAMKVHVGEHQAAMLEPFLKELANNANHTDMASRLGAQASEFFRQNTIATLIGFNPGTVMKHTSTALLNSLNEVGAVPWMREAMTLLYDLPQGRTNWKMAFEKSEEIQRRMRNFQDLIRGHGVEIGIRGAGGETAGVQAFNSFREFMMQAGATPVAIGDLLSTVPTWLAKYKRLIADGVDEGQAVFEANRAVRRAHGSSALSNRPALMRGGPLSQWFASLYGFFSHMMQKQYELAWKSKDFGRAVRMGDFAEARRLGWQVTKGLMSYIFWPAAIEELVTPYTNSEKDSWGMKAAKALTMGISSSFIGFRDAIRALINVRDPQAGLIGTSLKGFVDIYRDLRKQQPFSKENAGRILNHTFALTGILTGLTNRSEGNMLEYLWRVHQRIERPKGPWEFATGMRYGKLDNRTQHARTFQEWKRHLYGGH